MCVVHGLYFCVGSCICPCGGWKATLTIASVHFLKTRSHTDLELGDRKAGLPAIFRNLSVSTTPELGLQACATAFICFLFNELRDKI